MQNQHSNSIMMSRQSGSRSGTPNSMVVLERGRESPSRPPSGRRSVNRKSPLKRGGSSLEILPADEEDGKRTASRLSNAADHENLRQTQSAGSQSRLGFGSNEHDGEGDGRAEAEAERRRSSSLDGRREVKTPDSPRKQVSLTTVKRNFEQHGMPKNEEVAKAILNPSLQNGIINDIPSSMNRNYELSHRKQQGQRLNQCETDAENNIVKNSEDIGESLERLTVKEAEGQGSSAKTRNKTEEIDSYYISHGSTSNFAAARANSSTGGDDAYYLSHKAPSSSTTSDTRQKTPDKAEQRAKQEEQSAVVTATRDPAQEGQEDGDDSDDDDEDDEEEGGEEEEEEGKAPFQLLGEFVEAVMEEDYENAEKLCKMVLLYEPDNQEAKQFQPLIQEMLKREREAQLWGSESDEDEDEDEDSDEDDNEDSEEEDEDDSEDDDDDEEEEEESSSSDEEEPEAEEEKPTRKVEK